MRPLVFIAGSLALMFAAASTGPDYLLVVIPVVCGTGAHVAFPPEAK